MGDSAKKYRMPTIPVDPDLFKKVEDAVGASGPTETVLKSFHLVSALVDYMVPVESGTGGILAYDMSVIVPDTGEIKNLRLFV